MVLSAGFSDHVEELLAGFGKDEVRLDCELGLVLSLLRPVLETEIDKEFRQRFGSA